MRSTCLVVLSLFATIAAADELVVPSADYPTIQSALNASVEGDEVVLLAGEYSGSGNQNLVMPDAAITLRGDTGVATDVVLRGPGHPFDGIIQAMRFSGSSSSGILVRDLSLQDFTGRNGGALTISDCSPTFENCHFEGNGTGGIDCFDSANGGAVYIRRSSASFIECDFYGNFSLPMVCTGAAADALGGAVYAIESQPTFDGCYFENNRALGSNFDPARGGAVFASGSTLTLRECTFNRNRTSAGLAQGGAVYAGSLLMSIDCEYENNVCNGVFDGSATGGAIHAQEGIVIGGSIRGSRAGLADDSTSARGGAVFARDLHLINTTVFGNQATAYVPDASSGGAIFSNGSVRISNSTIASNTARGPAQMISGDVSSLEIHNSVVRNGFDWTNMPSSVISITYSNIEGGHAGEGNIDADPLFEAGTHYLLPGSPCIDAGSTDLLPADEFDLDGDGDTTEPLPLDAAGLARFVDDPATPDTGLGFPVVDMGAFEYQPPCRVDLDGDGALTIFDFLVFFNAFDDADPVADFDGDGTFTVFDFLAFQNEFDAGCE